MEVGKLNVVRRSGSGSSVSRKLRQVGKIPGICYGGGQDPVLLALDPGELLKSLDPQKRTNTVIAMTISDAPGGTAKPEVQNVMLREWQRDSLKGNVTHADFIRVDLTKEVHATVPIVLTGKAEGVKLGGTLHQVIRALQISCTPDKIPLQIEIAVDALNMGDALHVSDLKLAAGLKPLIAGGQTICTVTAPKAEKVTAAETEAAEAAAAAETAAAAAPAEGGDKKAGDKKAEAKPAAGDKKAEGKPAAEKKK